MSKRIMSDNKYNSKQEEDPYKDLSPKEKVKKYLVTIEERLFDDLQSQSINLPKSKVNIHEC